MPDTTNEKSGLKIKNPETVEQLNKMMNELRSNQTTTHTRDINNPQTINYLALFTGDDKKLKVSAVAALGKQLKKEVFRVDLSGILSKYIGETEKNLETVFAKATQKDWILFFDEADALFGKRTDVKDAHDKYANQEVSYLLQKLETFNGLAILASNKKNNIDTGFLSRLRSIVHFDEPQDPDK
ncbi:MAG: ATP-binding protein [Agriterribacter sp.]